MPSPLTSPALPVDAPKVEFAWVPRSVQPAAGSSPEGGPEPHEHRAHVGDRGVPVVRADREIRVAVPVPVAGAHAGEPAELGACLAPFGLPRGPGAGPGRRPGEHPNAALFRARRAGPPALSDDHVGVPVVVEVAQLHRRAEATAGLGAYDEPAGRRRKPIGPAVVEPGLARVGAGGVQVRFGDQQVVEPVAVHVPARGLVVAQVGLGLAAGDPPLRSAGRALTTGEEVRPALFGERPVREVVADEDVAPAVSVDVAGRGDRRAEAPGAGPRLQDVIGVRRRPRGAPEVQQGAAVAAARAHHEVGVAVPVGIAGRRDGGAERRVARWRGQRPGRRGRQRRGAPGPDPDPAGARVFGPDRELAVPVPVQVAEPRRRPPQVLVVLAAVDGEGGGVPGPGEPAQEDQREAALGPGLVPVLRGHHDVAEAIAVDVASAGPPGAQRGAGLGALERPVRLGVRHGLAAEEQEDSAPVDVAAVPRGRAEEQVRVAVAVDVAGGGERPHRRAFLPGLEAPALRRVQPARAPVEQRRDPLVSGRAVPAGGGHQDVVVAVLVHVADARAAAVPPQARAGLVTLQRPVGCDLEARGGAQEHVDPPLLHVVSVPARSAHQHVGEAIAVDVSCPRDGLPGEGAALRGEGGPGGRVGQRRGDEGGGIADQRQLRLGARARTQAGGDGPREGTRPE